MSGATDSGMVKMMGIVMAALAVFAVLCAIAARMLGADGDNSNDPLMRNALMQRIEPVAAVRTSAEDLPAASEVVAAVSSGPKSGEELANGACAACHSSGMAGVPQLGDETAWAARRDVGLEALVSSVINGKGAMPARGASAYSDDEILAAVQYMAGLETEDSAAADAPATSSEDTAEAEPAAPVEEAVAALVVGQVPENLSDNVKTTVDGLCISCHISGVGNAPKLGDTAAWQERADKGLAALTDSVINGLNVMPPRGGSTLTDEEIPSAIQYLMSK
ncbi:MAG: cytochrome c5 family protein [Granulosicoccus sp.]